VRQYYQRMVEAATRLALRSSTKTAYASLQRTMLHGMGELVISPLSPLSENELCLLALWYARGHKLTSLQPFLAAVRNYHIASGWGELPKSHLFTAVMAGLHNARPDGTALPRKVLPFHTLLNMRVVLNVATAKGAMLWCAFCLAFFGCLRVSEFTNGHLRVCDVRVTEKCVELTIVLSKTSSVPQVVRMATRADSCCPRVAWLDWLQFRPSAKVGIGTDAPAFTISNEPLTAAQFNRELRAALKDVGVDPTGYGSHSLRRGCATAMHKAGISAFDIMAHGRWKSLAFLGYIDDETPIVWKPVAF
jgi:integrase